MNDDLVFAIISCAIVASTFAACIYVAVMLF